jgi:hypothetical protein
MCHSFSTVDRKRADEEKSQINLLIINSFVFDDQWMDNILPTPDVCPQIIIRPHAKDKPECNGRIQAQQGGDVFCYPKMIGEWGSAHMKYIWVRASQRREEQLSTDHRRSGTRPVGCASWSLRPILCRMIGNLSRT